MFVSQMTTGSTRHKGKKRESGNVEKKKPYKEANEAEFYRRHLEKPSETLKQERRNI